MSIPALPSEVSSDGREIWDWAGKLGEWTAREHKKRELRRQIREINSECGSCIHWMHRECPMEKHSNVTGRSVGPSMKGRICGKFSMKQWDANLSDQWKSELAALEAKT